MTVKKDPSTLEEELTLLLKKYKVTMVLGAQAVPTNPEGTTFGMRPTLQFISTEP